MYSYGGLTFDGCVVRVKDGVADNAPILRALVLDLQACRSIIAELVNCYDELTVTDKELLPEEKVTDSKVSITSMSTQEITKLVEGINTIEELESLEVEEQANGDYRFLGGRKGVLLVLQTRRTELQG